VLSQSLKTLLSSLKSKAISPTSDPKFFLGNEKPFLNKFINLLSNQVHPNKTF